jgi:hypothetical protein
VNSVFNQASDRECPTCVKLAFEDVIDRESIMPLLLFPARSIYSGERICPDCQAAENLVKAGILPEFDMARISVATERLEHLRLPFGMSEHMGMTKSRLMKPCSIDDLKRHQDWLRKKGFLNE